jgi:signal transduction histidine kinase
LKNLLTVMVGCVESIGRTMPAGTTVAVDLVELRQAIDGAVDLVNELLVVGHARPVEPPLFIDISRLVVQMDATLSRILGPKIDLRMRLTTMGGIVRAAPVELEGILLNLVSRARDAMPDGGVVTIETSSFELGGDADEPREEPRRYVRLSVSDSGPGRAANERTTILDSLFTTEEKDTGLGLHGVNLVVQRLNGLLRIESQEGVGTQVHVCLPLALQESGL